MHRVRNRLVIGLGIFCLTRFAGGAQSQGDAQRGAQAFGPCSACHSIKPGDHMTGPSLAHAWGHKAGTAEGFTRYSDALKKSGVTWNEQTLDKWLTGPAAFIPGNSMTFPGIKEAKTRHDVIAYLKAVSEGKAPAARRGGGMMGGGMMGSGRTNLKQAPPDAHVVSITHCRDTYSVTTTSGQTQKIWEYNLRLKTDSSEYGPERGKPVITGSGMMGDRASVLFASPSEISTFIKESCQ